MYGHLHGKRILASNIDGISAYGGFCEHEEDQPAQDAKFAMGEHRESVVMIGAFMHATQIYSDRKPRPAVDVFGYTECGESITVRLVGPMPEYLCKVPAGYDPEAFLNEINEVLVETLSIPMPGDEDSPIETELIYSLDASYFNFERPLPFVALRSNDSNLLRRSKDPIVDYFYGVRDGIDMFDDESVTAMDRVHHDNETFPLRFSETIGVSQYGYHVMMRTGVPLIGHIQINMYKSIDAGRSPWKTKRAIYASMDDVVIADESVSLLKYLMSVSYDLETDNLDPDRRKISSPIMDPIITIGAVFYRALDDTPLLNIAFYYRSKPSIKVPNTLLILCENEKEMIQAFFKVLDRMNTDVLLSFNGDSFDNPYTWGRADCTGAKATIQTEFSRYRSPNHFEKIAFSMGETYKGDGIVKTGLARFKTDQRACFDARLYYQARQPKEFGEKGNLNAMMLYYKVKAPDYVEEDDDPFSIAMAARMAAEEAAADGGEGSSKDASPNPSPSKGESSSSSSSPSSSSSSSSSSSPITVSSDEPPNSTGGAGLAAEAVAERVAQGPKPTLPSGVMQKRELPIKTMYKYWREADSYAVSDKKTKKELQWKVAEILKYCVRDCWSTHLLILETGVYYDLFERATASFTTFTDSMHRADGLRVIRSAARYATDMRFALMDETPPIDYQIYPSERIGGGEVQACDPGHHIAITAMDFTSQYPAQKEAKNIDTSTKVPPAVIDAPELFGLELAHKRRIVDCYGPRWKYVFRVTDVGNVPEELSEVNAQDDAARGYQYDAARGSQAQVFSPGVYIGKEYVVEQFWAVGDRLEDDGEMHEYRRETFYAQSPRGADSRPSEHYSIKEVMLTDLRNMRIAFKKVLKGHKKSLKRMAKNEIEYTPDQYTEARNGKHRFDGKQLGVKVLMNTEYGITAADIYPLFDPTTGATVTWCSRTLIGFLRECLSASEIILSNEIAETDSFQAMLADYNAKCPAAPMTLVECELQDFVWRAVTEEEITSGFASEALREVQTHVLTDAETLREDRPATERWYKLTYPRASVVYQDTDSNYFKCDAIKQAFNGIEDSRERLYRMMLAMNAYNLVIRTAVVEVINRPPIGLGFEGSFSIAYYWPQKKRYIGIKCDETPVSVDDVYINVDFNGYEPGTDISAFLEEHHVKVTGAAIIRRDTPMFIIEGLFVFLQKLLCFTPPDSLTSVAEMILSQFLDKFPQKDPETGNMIAPISPIDPIELSQRQKYNKGKNNAVTAIVARLVRTIAAYKEKASRARKLISDGLRVGSITESEVAHLTHIANTWDARANEKSMVMPENFSVIRFVVTKMVQYAGVSDDRGEDRKLLNGEDIRDLTEEVTTTTQDTQDLGDYLHLGDDVEDETEVGADYTDNHCDNDTTDANECAEPIGHQLSRHLEHSGLQLEGHDMSAELYALRDAHGSLPSATRPRLRMLTELDHTDERIEIDEAYYHFRLARALATFLFSELMPREYEDVRQIEDKKKRTEGLNAIRNKIAAQLQSRHFTVAGMTKQSKNAYVHMRDQIADHVVIDPRHVKDVRSMLTTLSRLDTGLRDLVERKLLGIVRRLEGRETKSHLAIKNELKDKTKTELRTELKRVAKMVKKSKTEYISMYLSVISKAHRIDKRLCERVLARRREGDTDGLLSTGMLEEIASSERFTHMEIEYMNYAKDIFTQDYKRLVVLKRLLNIG